MESVTEKFLRYVKVDTQSDELSETFPSTKKQFNLAGMLVEELKNMGVSDVYFDEKYCYVYANKSITGTFASSPNCFIALIYAKLLPP